jgi:hypothetical protein
MQTVKLFVKSLFSVTTDHSFHAIVVPTAAAVET